MAWNPGKPIGGEDEPGITWVLGEYWDGTGRVYAGYHVDIDITMRLMGHVCWKNNRGNTVGPPDWPTRRREI